MPRMSKSFEGPAPSTSVKLHTPIPMSSPRARLLGLLAAQVVVADDLPRLVHGGLVVAAVVLPPERGLVGEGLLGDEVLLAQTRRILADLVRERVDDALHAVHGLGDAEGAAVGDAAGRLVGVHGVHLGVRLLHVVGAGADGEQAGRPLGGRGLGVGVAVVGDGLDCAVRGSCRRRPRRARRPCGSRARRSRPGGSPSGPRSTSRACRGRRRRRWRRRSRDRRAPCRRTRRRCRGRRRGSSPRRGRRARPRGRARCGWRAGPGSSCRR